jgi:glycosyltransferase involved in cell wall biosynthesis
MQQPSVELPAPQPPCRVVVLLSAYNGSKFIVEQIRSILVQLPSDGLLMVRDDGSKDNTCDLVEHLGDHRIELIRGANIGFSRSFLTLLSLAPADADLVMFSDQDDVWMPDKMHRAWAHLQPLSGSPALYGSAQMLVDADLRPLQPTKPWPRGPSLHSALTENIITGCTAAWNRPALELLQRAGVPQQVHLHDWWLYLVVSAFGQVVWDDRPSIFYRQHGNNQIGHGAGWWGRHLGVIRALRRGDWVGTLLAQIHSLEKYYGPELPPTVRELVLRYFEIRGERALPRWRLIFSLKRWRQGPAWDLALRLLLLAHRLQIWPPRSRRI